MFLEWKFDLIHLILLEHQIDLYYANTLLLIYAKSEKKKLTYIEGFMFPQDWERFTESLRISCVSMQCGGKLRRSRSHLDPTWWSRDSSE